MPVIYQWPDGSEVVLEFKVATAYSEGPWLPGDKIIEFSLFSRNEAEHTLGVVRMFTSTSGTEKEKKLSITNRTLEATREKWFPEKKIRGFLLDLGAERRWEFDIRGLLATCTNRPSSVVPYPRWVPDELWVQRYDLVQERILGKLGATSVQVMQEAFKKPPFLGYLLHFTVQSDEVTLPNGRSRTDWVIHSGKPPNGTSPSSGQSIEEALDAHLREELLLPLSEKESWDSKRVEFGQWVLPEPEEVELYQMLGEPLPFFWGYDRLKQWIEERTR